ncbi:MAG: hypothetical protein M3357_12580 [Actinomycetota bacterium]|nr:hypothetical protein [Actinomycetota bacterium]
MLQRNAATGGVPVQPVGGASAQRQVLQSNAASDRLQDDVLTATFAGLD